MNTNASLAVFISRRGRGRRVGRGAGTPHYRSETRPYPGSSHPQKL